MTTQCHNYGEPCSRRRKRLKNPVDFGALKDEKSNKSGQILDHTRQAVVNLTKGEQFDCDAAITSDDLFNDDIFRSFKRQSKIKRRMRRQW